jgi:hypothetical protein
MAQRFGVVDPIGDMISAELGLRQNREKQLANEKTEAGAPYWAQNAQSEADIHQTKAMYGPQKAMMDYQQSIVDLEKARLELEMYPENQNSLNNYRNALTNQNIIKNNNPGLLGSGRGKDIATLDVIEGIGGRGQPMAGYASYGGQNGLPPIAPKANPNMVTNPMENAGVNAQIAANPALDNNNYPEVSPVQAAGGRDPIAVAREELGKSGAELAREKEFGIQDAKVYADRMAAINSEAGLASEENATIDTILDIYKKVPGIQKGALQGELKALNMDAKLVDALESGLVLKELQKQKGTQSEGDRQEIVKTLQGRTLNNDTKEELLTLYKINNNREIEKQEFFADRRGQDPYQIEKEWNQKIQKSSIFKEPEYQLMKWNQKIRKMTPEQRKQAIAEQNLKIQLMEQGGLK